ncbi:MAG: GerMN domain-containing protein [Clostridia bacterium]|nr:GerMN domain-containing protein [Clostridia bacterium]
MKKLRLIYLFYLIIITLAGCVREFSPQTEPVSITVYYADRQMMKLIPMDYTVKPSTPQKQCNRIIQELTAERVYSSNIRRMLPEGSVSVKVKDDVATVNILSEYFSGTEKVNLVENLIVFQLVNSISSVEGISRVEFLIDGEKQKDFLGFIDMREAFVPDYYV